MALLLTLRGERSWPAAVHPTPLPSGARPWQSRAWAPFSALFRVEPPGSMGCCPSCFTSTRCRLACNCTRSGGFRLPTFRPAWKVVKAADPADAPLPRRSLLNVEQALENVLLVGGTAPRRFGGGFVNSFAQGPCMRSSGTAVPHVARLARANYVENGSRSEQRPSALSAR